MLTMKQAAEKAAVSKPTIQRYIKSGKLSATRLDDGTYRIDPSELFRVFQNSAVTMKQPATPSELNYETDRQVTLLREMLAMAKAQNEELKADRDAWRSQAERLVLTHQIPIKKSWWRRSA